MSFRSLHASTWPCGASPITDDPERGLSLALDAALYCWPGYDLSHAGQRVFAFTGRERGPRLAETLSRAVIA